MNSKKGTEAYRGTSIRVPVSGFEAYIIELATSHGLVYRKTDEDELAQQLTRLSDDEVVMDDIECLIIALFRDGVLNSENIMKIHHGYLKEKFNV